MSSIRCKCFELRILLSVDTLLMLQLKFVVESPEKNRKWNVPWSPYIVLFMFVWQECSNDLKPAWISVLPVCSLSHASGCVLGKADGADEL